MDNLQNRVDAYHDITALSNSAELARLRDDMRRLFVDLIDTPEVCNGEIIGEGAGMKVDRQSFGRILQNEGVTGTGLDDILKFTQETPIDPLSGDILDWAAANMLGYGIPDRKGFTATSFEYTLSSLNKGLGNKMFEVAQRVKVVTGVNNFRAKIVVDREAYKKTRDPRQIVEEADVQIRSSTGYDSSLEGIGTLPYLVLRELKNRGIKAVWIGIDPPGQLNSQLAKAYDEGDLDNPFLRSLTNYNLTWEVISNLLRFNNPKGLVEVGHSRGACLKFFDGKDKWTDPKVGHVLIAPVFKHEGVNPLIAKFGLGKGSQLIDLLRAEKIFSVFSDALIKYYVGKDSPKMNKLYSRVFNQMMQAGYGEVVLYKFINDLLNTQMPDLSNLNIDPSRNSIINFIGDKFIDFKGMEKAQEKGLGAHNTQIVTNLQGGHCDWTTESPKSPKHIKNNEKVVVQKIVDSAMAVTS